MILLALALLVADPSSIQSVIDHARPGDAIRLVAGNYPAIMIRSKTWVPGITVDATAARSAGVKMSGTTGFAWNGGIIAGTASLPAATGGGFVANYGSANISVTNVHFSDLRLGVALERVTGANIAGNWFTRMSSDGIDVSLSRNVVIDRNTCTDFAPAPLAHPDCIQLWSRPILPPTADITISNNSAVGAMQGISLFNHIRDGVDDGGFDRIMIKNNTVLNTYGDGVSAFDCRGCIIRDNDINSLPNYVNRAQLYIVGGSITQCGNKVPMVPRQSTPACNT